MNALQEADKDHSGTRHLKHKGQKIMPDKTSGEVCDEHPNCAVAECYTRKPVITASQEMIGFDQG